MTRAELLAGLEPYTKDCQCVVCQSMRKKLEPDTSATSGPQTADTQPPRQDYHTSAIPGDGWMLVERTIAHD